MYFIIYDCDVVLDRALTAFGKKLFVKRLVLVLIDRYRRPEGSISKSSKAGCDSSRAIDLAFLMRRLLYMSSRLGSSAPIILEAVLTILFRDALSALEILPYQTGIAKVKTLSMMAL